MSNEGQGWLDNCSQLSAKLPTQQNSHAAMPLLHCHTSQRHSRDNCAPSMSDLRT